MVLIIRVPNVENTAEVHDVQIVLHGLIHDLAHIDMMDIVLRVSNKYFQMTNEVK